MSDATTSASSTLSIAVSALQAQQARMRVIAENVANSDSIATTPGGDPYRRRAPVFAPVSLGHGDIGVAMKGVRDDPTPFQVKYDPGNPAADAKGNVKLPNVDPLIEALDMKGAQRAYEANLNVIETVRTMQMRTLDLLKS